MHASRTDTVLIIIDMVQDYFNADLWPGSRIPEERGRLVKNTNALSTQLRAFDVPVIWFRQEFLPDLSDAFQHMRRDNRRYAIKGTAGPLLLPELDVAEDDVVLVKKRYSAFYGTVLDDVLRKMNAQTLVLAGITSAWCVKSTAVDAYQRDYQLIFAKECMAGFSEKEHLDAVESMHSLLGPALTNGEIVELFD